MLYTLTQQDPTQISSECLIIGLYENAALTPAAKLIDDSNNSFISELISQNDFTGKYAQTLILFKLPNLRAKRIMLVGCGVRGKLCEKQYSQLLNQVYKALQNTGAKEAVTYLTEVEVKQRDEAWKVRQLVEQAYYSNYRFKGYKKQPETEARLQNLKVAAAPASEKALAEAMAIGKANHFTRELADLPPNVCTPSYLAEQAQQLAHSYPSLQTEILDVAAMEKIGMGALLAVAKGSHNPAKFIIVKYQGSTPEQAPVVLVGKGVTFDTGGICLKPKENMDEMKYDMCGAASVLGTLLALAELKLPLNVIGLIPTVENMPDGLAYRPGDIVTSLSGQTIEILNTDAEGRLILCDALTFAERFKPAVVIDVATLTGAMIIALGFHTTGLFSNDDKLALELLNAADASNEPTWRLPYNHQYQEALNSNFADMANSAGRDAGSITATCFLSRFTESYSWAHLDIAGTASKGGKEKGATGRPVALLVQFLLNRAT